MLSPIQRRQLIFSITESQNANPEAKTLAKTAMEIIDKQSTKISCFLNSKSSVADKNNALYAILKPVGDSCNLRCKYCFNQSSQKTKIMSIEVLEAIIAQVLDFCPEVANFTFHGGEPLLAGIEFFETAIALQQKYAKPNHHIHNSVQTNATLINEEWGRFFSKHKIKVGTSIDGPSHDSRRLDPAGRGTLSRVIKGIQTVQSHGIEVGSISVITCPSPVSPQNI